MADPIHNALRRKLAAADAAGDDARMDKIRSRMAGTEAAQPDVTPVAAPADLASGGLTAGLGVDSFKRRKTKTDVERIAGATDDGDD